jgi:hypothetical protein
MFTLRPTRFRRLTEEEHALLHRFRALSLAERTHALRALRRLAGNARRVPDATPGPGHSAEPFVFISVDTSRPAATERQNP